jgi:hypothetical protein
LTHVSDQVGTGAALETTGGPDRVAAGGPLVSLEHATFMHEPFPRGVIRPVFAEDVYEELLATFPPVDEFLYKPHLGDKYSLSEVNNSSQYRDWIKRHDIWHRLRAEIKSPEFTDRVLRLLRDHQIDLGLLGEDEVGRIRHARNKLGRYRRRQIGAGELWQHLAARPRRTPMTTRFEFSMLPAAGGHILPHTDAPQKLITLVFSMERPGEWDDAWGGGTSMDRPKDPRRTFNHVNDWMKFDEVESFEQMPFEPNQCVFFIKTFNSFHSVPPMTGPEGTMRRTLTLNIERAGVV